MKIRDFFIGFLAAIFIGFVSYSSGEQQCKLDNHVNKCVDTFIPVKP